MESRGQRSPHPFSVHTPLGLLDHNWHAGRLKTLANASTPLPQNGKQTGVCTQTKNILNMDECWCFDVIFDKFHLKHFLLCTIDWQSVQVVDGWVAIILFWFFIALIATLQEQAQMCTVCSGISKDSAQFNELCRRYVIFNIFFPHGKHVFFSL